MYRHDDVQQPRDRRAWTDDEDELLRAAIETEDGDANPPSKWHAIAKHIPNRTNKDCRKRWWAQMATRVSKGSWSAEEDERLFAAVDELGTKWAAVASRVGTRNSGQCAKRWNDALNPAIDRSGWTPEEDQRLLKAVESQGHCWANIARTYLPGRTGLAAKNRYNHLIRGSSDRSPSSRGRRMSAAAAMRRRSTRGSSISSMSTPSSPRSTATPPPSSSGASSPESSAMPPTPTEIYAMHAPLDFRHAHAHHPHHAKWSPIHDVPLFDDVHGLGLSGGPHEHPSTPSGLESDMMSMLMHNSFNDFLDPSIDPAALGPLSPTYPLDAPCGSGVMLSDAANSVDPWAMNGYPSYLDMSPAGPLGSAPPQLTPNMSSSGESSVNSTPQLGHPHFSSRFLQQQQHQHQHQQQQQQHDAHYFAAGPSYLQPLTPGAIDAQDPRFAAALAMCDPYPSPHGSMHHPAAHMASILGHHRAAGGQ